ncbi:heavy metal translocating P-type ATPase [Neisseria sp. Dent CA1/247]|uniref:heavy metal translocating P-type ATPase n=1 Tax=Neisseria sp. Dent CA1/247 TaxID=2912675 RepID=UPI001FD3DBA5|nr:heavy metal translocating P-type ATPase [Neisseria sp. Dent CA1/247]UOO75952.1 heavy metal translocating P-type ATPase [Neisseria sp. Dent CA1/247]
MQQKARFQIDGMTCQACASRIEKVLNKKDFVQTASVNFAGEEAQVVFDDGRADADTLIHIIEKAGFKAVLKTDAPMQPEAEPHIGWRLWLLLAINVPFLFGMVGMMIGRHNWMMPPMWQFVLASIVQLWLAVPFYKSAWASIKGGLANMDVLVTVGTAAIYLYSVFMLFFHPHAHHGDMAHVYFEAGVMVVGFVSLGKFLEHRAKKNSLNSLSLLLKLTPRQVSVQRGGQWQEVPLDNVQIGDLIRANHGERIAADGTVESGNGWADESHLTGESNPEAKTAGSKVLAGAVMTDGSVVYRAEQLGSQTLLGDMMAALSEAQGSKAPIARIADKVAAVFVPAVVGIAVITFLITWYVKADWVTALMNAVAVLVIACPCALGLATPAAIMVGMGKAVKHGIWFKDAAAMEEAAHVNAVVLDKTGTLTQGKPQVAAVWLRPSEKPSALESETAAIDENELYRLAAAVEQNATHPLAAAIVQTALSHGISIPEAQNAQTAVGAGISAEIDGAGLVKVGKPDYCHLVLPDNLDSVWRIATIVAVSVNDQPVGAFALADALKADTQEAIGRLKNHGIDVYIMSGDNQNVVGYIAEQLGIAHAYGNMSPRDKAAEVQKLKNAGKVVAMVGDGINDAPALAAANVSFAMKDGADVAEHTASATLMQHSVNQMVDALLISRATLKNIKQNLFFAFIYNTLGIPLAAFGFLNPIIAGAAMAMSSVSVLGNALRLKRVKIE